MGDKKLIIIGGIPRSGKSTLVRKLISKRPGFDTVHLDAFRMSLAKGFDVCKTEDEQLLWDNPAVAIAEYRKRDEALYSYALPMINSLVKNGTSSVICEGLFLPDVVSAGDFPHTGDEDICEIHLVRRAVSIDEEFEILEEICRTAPGSWLAKHSPDDLRKYAEVSLTYSEHISAMADAAGKKVFDMLQPDVLNGALYHIEMFLDRGSISPNSTF